MSPGGPEWDKKNERTQTFNQIKQETQKRTIKKKKGKKLKIFNKITYLLKTDVYIF
ncbi:unnamed protein product [marine sediment metagenome]|uniref:Uncharacterized protein n=1 Tax=marine sediment metagenome TaxID=412755 RepID=X1G229_9ZZZZ